MKKLFLGICFSLISQIVICQTVSGRVVDASTGQPLPSASVQLDATFSSVSSQDGRFTFNNLRKGRHRIQISSVGYQSLDTTVERNANILVFALVPWRLMMQPVEVKAIRASDNSPFTKTNLSKKDIETVNLGQDLPFLVSQTPSVVINSDAGNGVGYTGIRIRGTDATRINMTINGLPYNDAESQGLFFVNLPDFASSVSSIQIQRGVGTSSNGAGAFGSTINFSTNEVNIQPYAELNNSVGSFQTWKNTVKVGSGLMNGHFTLDARLSNIRSEGYVDRASTRLQSYYVSGAWIGSNTSIRLNVMSGKEKTYQAWYGIPESYLDNNRTYNAAGTERPGKPYDNETDNYKQDHYQLFFNHAFSPRLTFNTAFFITNGKGYYEQYKADQSFSKYGLPDFNDSVTSTDLIRQLWLDNSYFGQIASFQYKNQGTQLTLGGGWNRYNGHHYGEIVWAGAGVPDHYRWYDHRAHKTDINLYGKWQQRLAAGLEAFIDMQYRMVNYDINGFRDNPGVKIDENYHFVNPKVGLSYQVNDHQVYLSYSRGQKEPNRDDFEAGANQVPKPEKLNDFEFGIEKRNGDWKWGATAYYMLYKDQLVLTGKINDVGAYTRVNIPDSYRLGIELQGSVRWQSWLTASANLTLSRNKVKNFTEYYDDYDNGGQKAINHGTTDIALSPACVGSAVLSFYPVKRAEIALVGKYVSRQFLDNTSNKARSLDPYYVQDLRISYTLEKFVVKSTSLLLQVNNLFNRKYEPNGYTFSYQYGGQLVTENYYFPMAGINLLVGVNIKL